MPRNPNFCLVPVTPRYVLVGAWLGLVWMILLGQIIRNCTVAAGTAGTAGARGWLCICSWCESWQAGPGLWLGVAPAPLGSGPCTPMLPMAFLWGLWLRPCTISWAGSASACGDSCCGDLEKQGRQGQNELGRC